MNSDVLQACHVVLVGCACLLTLCGVAFTVAIVIAIFVDLLKGKP